MVVRNLHLELECECSQRLEAEDAPDRSQRPYVNFLLELCIDMLTEHSTKPVRRRSVVGNAGETRFDNLGGNWIVSTKEEAASKAKRGNCKMCHIKGKSDLKSIYMCEKC
jgi:hypothetical protein